MHTPSPPDFAAPDSEQPSARKKIKKFTTERKVWIAGIAAVSALVLVGASIFIYRGTQDAPMTEAQAESVLVTDRADRLADAIAKLEDTHKGAQTLLASLEQLSIELQPQFYSGDFLDDFIDSVADLRLAVDRDQNIVRNNATLVGSRAGVLNQYIAHSLTTAKTIITQLVDTATEYLKAYEYANDDSRNQTATIINKLTTLLADSSSIVPVAEVLSLQNSLSALVENDQLNRPADDKAPPSGTIRPPKNNADADSSSANNSGSDQSTTCRKPPKLRENWFDEFGREWTQGIEGCEAYYFILNRHGYVPQPLTEEEKAAAEHEWSIMKWEITSYGVHVEAPPWIPESGEGLEQWCVEEEEGIYAEVIVGPSYEIQIPDGNITYPIITHDDGRGTAYVKTCVGGIHYGQWQK